jgi:hypothetical protein
MAAQEGKLTVWDGKQPGQLSFQVTPAESGPRGLERGGGQRIGICQHPPQGGAQLVMVHQAPRSGTAAGLSSRASRLDRQRALVGPILPTGMPRTRLMSS